MDRRERMEKENTTLSTERCEIIDTLYINKIIVLDENIHRISSWEVCFRSVVFQFC